MILDLLLTIVKSIQLVVACAHFRKTCGIVGEMFIQVYLGTIQIDLLMLFYLRCLVLLNLIMDYLELAFDPSAFLMPLFWINPRLHHILRQLQNFILLRIVTSCTCRIELIRGVPASTSGCCCCRTEFHVVLPTLSYIILIKKLGHINETGGHHIIVLVIVITLVRRVQHIKHLTTCLYVNGCHVFGCAALTAVLVVVIGLL
jgi:hypothetical protein